VASTISVLILTLDEEVNIADCLASLPWREDVWVLDSGSSDRTLEIAEAAGARVETRAFTDYADQRNHGLALPAGDWIVMLDADERMTPELAAEIQSHIDRSDTPDTVMFRMRRKDMFAGRWLRRSSGYPTWFPRVFRRGRVHVERKINETYRADGDVASLEGHLLHFPFNKGIDWWFERHRRYAAAEAELLIAKGASEPASASALISRDPAARRAALKRLAYRMPGRPLLAFLYLYVLRLGFLDGRAGYSYACMRLAYETMIDADVARFAQQRPSEARLQE
jgi:glycosyltransferase involved in cell wall biosynthesis